MPKSRTGKRLDDIFSSPAQETRSTGAAVEEEAPPASAHNKHTEPYDKATVVLFKRQTKFLDRLALDMADKPGKWSRTEIIRALVEALERSGFDVTGADSEEALTELLTKRFSGRK